MASIKALYLFFCIVISELGAVPLLLSWTTSIKLFEENDPFNMTTITPRIIQSVDVDYHYARGEYYFCNGDGRIYRGSLRSANEQPIIIVEVTMAEGIAVDWINDNLYWTDPMGPRIEMSNLDGLYRNTIFNSSHGLDKPRAIVLDPFKGILFWSDWGENPRVESSGLDGGQRQAVISSELIWPNNLALDWENEKLFILDGFTSTLISISYDGSNKRQLGNSQEKMQHTFGLTFYNNRLFWIKYEKNTVLSIDISTRSITEVYKRNITSQLVQILIGRMNGLKAYHPSLQRSGSNPCDNSQCSHKCLLQRGGHRTTCVCPFGYELASDRRTCVEKGYLLESWSLTIRRSNLEGGNRQRMIDGTMDAVSIDYHLKKNFVFWSEPLVPAIYKAPLGQFNNKTKLVASEAAGLAVDWVHNVLYWVDTDKRTVEASDLEGSNQATIIQNNLEKPRALAVDPLSGYIFWSDWGSEPKIERSSLDGLNREAIVQHGLVWPNGITLDLEEMRLYWVDGRLTTISSVAYDGSRRKLVLGFQTTSPQPFSITIFKDNVYWTDWRIQGIIKARKSDITEVELLSNSSAPLLRPNTVKVVHTSLQKERANPCQAISCPGLCLGTSPGRAHCIGK